MEQRMARVSVGQMAWALAAAGLIALAAPGPARAGGWVGSGDWHCAGSNVRGQTLTECLALRLKLACPNGACAFALPRLPHLVVHPPNHAQALLLASRPRVGHRMPRIRLVLDAVQGGISAIMGKRRVAKWSGFVCSSGVLESWGPTALDCLADLLLLACPADVEDERKCVESARLDTPEVMPLRPNPRTDANAGQQLTRPPPISLPPMAKIRRAATRRAARLARAFRPHLRKAPPTERQLPP